MGSDEMGVFQILNPPKSETVAHPKLLQLGRIAKTSVLDGEPPNFELDRAEILAA